MPSQKKTVVLVVEDEPIILLNAVDMVELAGMIALSARTAIKALELLEIRDDIALVFTDIDLPGTMDGLALGRKIRNRWPHISLIFTSGHMLSRTIAAPEGGMFLPKPYLDEELIAMMHSMLGAPSEAKGAH